jgi:hypothetical protein
MLVVGLSPSRPGTAIRAARVPSDYLRSGDAELADLVGAPSTVNQPADGPDEQPDATMPDLRVDPVTFLPPYADSVILPGLDRICRTPAPEGALHVAVDGDDDNSGDIDQPLARIATAVARAEPGQTVLVRGGTYRQQVPIRETYGTPDAWITLRSFPGERAIIESGLGEAAIGFRRGNAYITVACLTLSGPALRPEAAPDSPEQMRNAVRAGRTGPARLPRNYGVGVDIGDLADFRAGRPANHHIRVVANEIRHYAEAGVGVTESNHISVIGNTIHGNAKHGCHSGSGISLSYLVDEGGPDNADGYSNYVVGNTIYGNENQSYQCFSDDLDGILTDGNGIIVDLTSRHGYTGRTLVADNLTFDNGGRGIFVFKSSRVDVFNNVAFENARTANLMGRDGPHPEIAVAEASDVRVYNNVAVPRPDNAAFLVDQADVDEQTNLFLGPGEGGRVFVNPSVEPDRADFTLRTDADPVRATAVLASLDLGGTPIVVDPASPGTIHTSGSGAGSGRS